MDTDTKQNAKVDDLMDQLNSLADGNHERRNTLITKLMEAVNKTDFDPQGLRASELESRLGIVSTIDSLMKSQESVQVNNIKLNLQQKKDDEEADHSSKVLQLLQQINPDSIPRPSAGDEKDIDAADEKISERIKQEEIEISEGEKEKVSTVVE